MSELSVAEVLERAADLIEPEGAWTQDWFARDDVGNPVDLSTEDERAQASCFCLYGAIGAAVCTDPERYKAADPFLCKAIGVASPAHVVEWNDAPERTQAEVVAKLREAANLAREQSNV